MKYAAMLLPWTITFMVIGYIMFVMSTIHQEDVDWQQKCKQDNGYPTQMMYMDYHSQWHRLCINPRSVVEIDND